MPATTEKLKRMMKSKYPFSEDNLGNVINIINNANKNSVAFECVAEQLKKRRLGELAVRNTVANGEDTEMTPAGADNDESTFDPADLSALAPVSTANIIAFNTKGNFASEASLVGSIQLEDKMDDSSSEIKSSRALSGLTEPTDKDILSNDSQQQEAKATVQVLDRPTAFGALLKNPAPGKEGLIFLDRLHVSS